jgi:hypothetical protein
MLYSASPVKAQAQVLGYVLKEVTQAAAEELATEAIFQITKKTTMEVGKIEFEGKPVEVCGFVLKDVVVYAKVDESGNKWGSTSKGKFALFECKVDITVLFASKEIKATKNGIFMPEPEIRASFNRKELDKKIKKQFINDNRFFNWFGFDNWTPALENLYTRAIRDLVIEEAEKQYIDSKEYKDQVAEFKKKNQ